MDAERARIDEGGTREPSYLYELCPNQGFDFASEDIVLIPKLPNLTIKCGGKEVGLQCVFLRGTTQIGIGEESASVTFDGIGFAEFTEAAVTGVGSASSSVSVTLKDGYFSNIDQATTLTQQNSNGDGFFCQLLRFDARQHGVEHAYPRSSLGRDRLFGPSRHSLHPTHESRSDDLEQLCSDGRRTSCCTRRSTAAS